MRHQKDVVATLQVIFATKLFTQTSVVGTGTGTALSAFQNVNWKFVAISGEPKSLSEAVADFLSSVVENVPEVFHFLQPLVDSLVDAVVSTRLSASGSSLFTAAR